MAVLKEQYLETGTTGSQTLDEWVKKSIAAGTATKGLIGPVGDLTKLFETFGLKTRTELTKELTEAEAALRTLKGSAEATPGAITALEDKIRTLKEGMTGLKTETRSLAEQLGISFRSETEDRVKKLNQALLEYRGKMTADQIIKIYQELETLDKTIRGIIPNAETMGQTIDRALSGLDDTAEDTAKAISDAFQDDAWDPIKRDAEQLMVNDLPAWMRDLPKPAEKATKEINNYFDGLYNDIATGWGNTIQKWLEGGVTFKNFIKGIWDDIKNSFFRMVGEMIAKWGMDLIRKGIEGVLSLAGSFGKVADGASGAASAIGGVGGGLKSLISFATGPIGIGLMIASLIGFKNIAKGLQEAWKAVWTGVVDILKTASKSISDIIGSISDAVSSMFGVFKSVFDGIGDLCKSLLGFLGSIFDALGGILKKIAGVSSKSSDVTYWLKGMWENLQIIQNLLSADFRGMVHELITGKNQTARRDDESNMHLQTIYDAIHAFRIDATKLLGQVRDYASDIVDAIGDLPHAATGGYFEKPAVVSLAEREPEYVLTKSQLAGAVPKAVTNITNNFLGEKTDPTPWFKTISDNIQKMAGAFSGVFDMIGEWPKSIADYIKQAVDMIGNRPIPAMIYASEAPEVINPIADLARMTTGFVPKNVSGGGSKTLNFYANINIKALDSKDVRDAVKTDIAPALVEIIRTNFHELGTKFKKAQGIE